MIEMFARHDENPGLYSDPKSVMMQMDSTSKVASILTQLEAASEGGPQPVIHLMQDC